MIRHLVLSALVACTPVLPAGADDTAGGRHLVLLTEQNPPYSLQDAETGAITGSAVDIVRELMRRAEVGYSLAVLPWARAYREAQEKPGTCVFATNRTPERETLFDWVGPLIEGGWAVYRRPGSRIVIESLDDLKTYVVAGKRGSASVTSLETAAGIRVVTTVSDELAARMLYHGRADLWISGVIDGPLATRAIGLPAPELALLWKKADLSLACGKGTDPALLAELNRINATLDALRKQLLAQYIDELEAVQ